MKKIVIIGGRGNGTVIASTIEDINKVSLSYKIVGFLNDGEKIGTLINGYPVLGPVSQELCNKYSDAFYIYALISVGKAEERVEKLKSLDIDDTKWINIIHPSVSIGSNCELGHGVILMPNVILSPNVKLGNFVQVYGNSIVGHDTLVEHYCFISNSSSIGSYITINEGAHIGSNCSIRERVIIGEWSLIGLGSVVLNDIEPFSKNVGVPSKRLGEVK